MSWLRFEPVISWIQVSCVTGWLQGQPITVWILVRCVTSCIQERCVTVWIQERHVRCVYKGVILLSEDKADMLLSD